MANIDVKSRLNFILQRIGQVYQSRPNSIHTGIPHLVAVSKTKPAELVIEAYLAGQRHFGENYVQELFEKSNNLELQRKCPDIKWHFIGHLQSNKAKKVIKVPNLYMIQSVDNEKLAKALDKAWGEQKHSSNHFLRVMIQLNCSGEKAKSGTNISEAPALYKYIKQNLNNLLVCGIMTIGSYGYDYSQGPNPDFVALMKVHNQICEENNIEPAKLEVSMGMSNDYDKAIEMGSTTVRIGSAIFGERNQKHV